MAKPFFSETSQILLFCGATRKDRKEPFYWRRGKKTLSIFNGRRDIKVDNDPENGQNCVLVYLKNQSELGYRYGSCHDDHYYLCSSKVDGNFFSGIKFFKNNFFICTFKKYSTLWKKLFTSGINLFFLILWNICLLNRKLLSFLHDYSKIDNMFCLRYRINTRLHMSTECFSREPKVIFHNFFSLTQPWNKISFSIIKRYTYFSSKPLAHPGGVE